MMSNEQLMDQSTEQLLTDQLMVKYLETEDQSDFQALYNDTHKVVRSYARKFFKRFRCGQELIEDVVQQVYVHLYQRRNDWNPDTRFMSWFYSLIRSVTIDVYRREMRRVQPESMTEVVTDNLGSTDPDPVPRDLVETALQSLSKDGAKLIRERYLEGLSLEELSAKYGKTVDCICKRIQKLLSKLRVNPALAEAF